MNKQNLTLLPLRELITGAEQASRELSEHLEQAVLPKAERLDVAIQDGAVHPITDIAVRRQVQEILDAHEFTSTRFEKIEQYLSTMQKSLDQILGTE